MTPIELIDLDELILSENNPRTISKDEMDRLCKSMQDDPDFMTLRPVLVNKDEEKGLVVYAGNQRVRAAKILGWKKIHCIVNDNLSDTVIKKRLIKDNMHAGDWDYDILANEFDMEMLLDVGFSEKDFDIDEEIIEDENNSDSKDEKVKHCPHCNGVL